MSKVLFAVSGSIAAFRAADVVSALVQREHDVQVVTTPAALKFVGTATWEGLTGRPVVSDIFAEGHQMDHIHLARWADILILCPATAQSIAQWAIGSGADLPSALFLAFERRKPVVAVPAMNKEMWSHPAVRENLRRLADWNVRVIEPEEGRLACGETGSGRLASVERIIAELDLALSARRSAGRVIVTSGATREPIDRVRFITNVSTGRTGAALADQMAASGYEVVYLYGQGAAMPTDRNIKLQEYSDFSSLQRSMRTLLQQPVKAVIHAAAVSDFSVDDLEAKDFTKTGGKLDSSQDLTLRLKRNPKLVLNLKEWTSPPAPVIVAFKLTDTDDPEQQRKAATTLLSRPEVDAVAWNNLKDVSAEGHSGVFYTKAGSPTAFASNTELGMKILDFLSDGAEHGPHN